MRIEDLDGPRVKPESAEQALDVLRWIGIDWDGDVSIQSDDLTPYVDALRMLAARDLVYPCTLSRREIEAAASAPHADGAELRFPPELRPPSGTHAIDRLDVNYRLRTAAETIVINDQVAGARACAPHEEIGDFVVWTKRGVPSYQLAVVVDDARSGVTDVLRGDDLLPSAARQTLLHRALTAGGSLPRWWHVPLVVGPDGRRLAKRHGDTRVATYREAGVPSRRIVGLLAFWCGITDDRQVMSPDDFRARFDVARLPREAISFTEEDHRWLLD